MKKLFLIMLLFGIQIPFLYAQNEMPAGPGQPQPKERITHLKKILNLNEEQSKKIESIFDNGRKQMEALIKKQKEEMEKFSSDQDAISENSDNEILKVLTDEQKSEFKSFSEERKNGHWNIHRPMGQMMPPPMGQRGESMGQMMPPPPMGQMNHQMGQMPPMGQFGGPEMGQQPGCNFTGERMPPPPQDCVSGDKNAPQDKQANGNGKRIKPAKGQKSEKKAVTSEKDSETK